MRTLPMGRLQLAILDDGMWRFPAHFFFRDLPEAVWREHAQPAADGKIPVGHNYALVEAASELIMIDTGYGDDTHGGQSGHLLEELERAGHRREQVTQVVITHAHGDHIKRNTLMRDGRRQPTFPNARYHLARADWDWFSGPGHVPEFDEQVAALDAFGLLSLFDGEFRLAPEILLLPTPGHTPGHTSVLIESQGESAIYLGDLCHHPAHFSHPEWVSAFDTHPQLTPRTRAWLFALALERDALLICPHAPAPGLGRLQRSIGGVAWQALA